MKNLISQNGVSVSSNREVRRFKCRECGAVFDSNEYTVTNNTLQSIISFILKDKCFTCKNDCIIIDEPYED